MNTVTNSSKRTNPMAGVLRQPDFRPLWLVGGAIVDRFSPRAVMLISDILRLLLVSVLAILVFTSTIQLWMLYAFGLIFGLLSGFFLPASISMVPNLVQPEELQAGNAVFLLEISGPGLAMGNWVAILSLIVPNAAALLYRTCVEEKALREHFGDAYMEYARITKRLIPGLL